MWFITMTKEELIDFLKHNLSIQINIDPHNTFSYDENDKGVKVRVKLILNVDNESITIDTSEDHCTL